MRVIEIFTLCLALTTTTAGAAKAPIGDLPAKPLPVPLPSPILPSSTCWDTENNGLCEAAEDYDGDGACTWVDCQSEFLDWMAADPCPSMATDARCGSPAYGGKGGLMKVLLTTVEVEGIGPVVDLALLGIQAGFGTSVALYDHSEASIDMREFGSDVLAQSFDPAEHLMAKELSYYLASPIATEVHVRCWAGTSGYFTEIEGPGAPPVAFVFTQADVTLAPFKVMNAIAQAVNAVR